MWEVGRGWGGGVKWWVGSFSERMDAYFAKHDTSYGKYVMSALLLGGGKYLELFAGSSTRSKRLVHLCPPIQEYRVQGINLVFT